MRHCPCPCALILLVSLPACFDNGPQRFSSLAELNSYEGKEGYVMIGRFGDGWPAEILTERLYHDKVEVILANSEVHTFEDFGGYELRVVKLKGEHNAEIVVVYRSRGKE